MQVIRATCTAALARALRWRSHSVSSWLNNIREHATIIHKSECRSTLPTFARWCVGRPFPASLGTYPQPQLRGHFWHGPSSHLPLRCSMFDGKSSHRFTAHICKCPTLLQGQDCHFPVSSRTDMDVTPPMIPKLRRAPQRDWGCRGASHLACRWRSRSSAPVAHIYVYDPPSLDLSFSAF